MGHPSRQNFRNRISVLQQSADLRLLTSVGNMKSLALSQKAREKRDTRFEINF
jgi:hypothetical protein